MRRAVKNSAQNAPESTNFIKKTGKGHPTGEGNRKRETYQTDYVLFIVYL